MNLPSVIPVMLLQQCNIFPHGLLPLYIFEPRYRAMLRHALLTDRLLCIGTMAPAEDGETGETDDRISEYSTASVIRACVGNEDGTSHLVLQGVQRVRILAWEQYEPFRIARIEAVETVCTSPGEAVTKSQELIDRVLGLMSNEKTAAVQLTMQLQQLTDPECRADFVAAHLIRDAATRQPLLGMAEVEDRLDYLLGLLPEAGENPAVS